MSISRWRFCDLSARIQSTSGYYWRFKKLRQNGYIFYVQFAIIYNAGRIYVTICPTVIQFLHISLVVSNVHYKSTFDIHQFIQQGQSRLFGFVQFNETTLFMARCVVMYTAAVTLRVTLCETLFFSEGMMHRDKLRDTVIFTRGAYPTYSRNTLLRLRSTTVWPICNTLSICKNLNMISWVCGRSEKQTAGYTDHPVGSDIIDSTITWPTESQMFYEDFTNFSENNNNNGYISLSDDWFSVILHLKRYKPCEMRRLPATYRSYHSSQRRRNIHYRNMV